MRAGDIWACKHFICKNGAELDRKFIVVLNKPPKIEIPYFACLATSQSKRKPTQIGCNPEDGYYKIEAKREWFEKETWLVLNDLYPFTSDEILKKCLEKGDLEKVGELAPTTIKAVIKCTQLCRDVTRYQKDIIRECAIQDECLK